VKLLLIFFFCILFISLEVFPQDSINYSWRYYRPGNTGIQGDQATALWLDENGDPYIAASTGNWGEGGFAKFIQSENKWINYSNVDYPVLGSFDNGDVQIFDIVEDYEKNLWMGNFSGAIKFSPSVGASSIEIFNANNSALNGFTFDIDLAPDSSIWFLSNGLAQFNPKERTWNYLQGGNTRLSVQPKTDGSYIVWSADTYFGYVYSFNSATNELVSYLPDTLGTVAGLPGKDCVDDVGNFWALRMAQNGDWETLEYQQPNGTWVYPTPPYSNVSFYIDAFKAFGNGKAVMVLVTGEVWFFNGSVWQNFGTWRSGDFNLSIDIDKPGNVWVCGIGGAAKRDATTGNWQRYRLTNTSQIDYFIEDFSLDNEGNAWFTGNAGAGIGGFQKFDGERWTGFNEFTYGLGFPFPFMADNTQAIYRRPSNGYVVFNPTFHGVYAWDGISFFTLSDTTSSQISFMEDSQGRLWSLGDADLRYFDENIHQWINKTFGGFSLKIENDREIPGTIWALTDQQIIRTNGTDSLLRSINDFPGSASVFNGMAVDNNGIVWVGTFSPFVQTGSTLIKFDSNSDTYTTLNHDQGWPFPGEHVYPRVVTPDGKLWLMYDSEYPSTDAGICWYDGKNIEVFPAPPGGVPQWGGLPNSNIEKIEYRTLSDGYELWMCCKGRGIAVLTVKQIPTTVDKEKIILSDFRLSQNYPNPFNPSTKIRYQVASTNPVSLKIYDVLGNEVAVLVNEVQPNGNYEVEFNASGLASGTYFYKLQAGEFIQTKKMIYLK